ncbi:MAG: TIGR01212 family radical SAM protein [Lachnospiraceae bacterium]|nr:TIGR01212 family radical SAM protein [Lachnospiraceae bacterium]
MITLSEHLKQRFGEKTYRLSLSSGCSCPNRDGYIGYGGCTFCSEGGSGEFAAAPAPIDDQINEAKKKISLKSDAGKFIAYFQSFTNTYGDVKRLKALYTEAIKRDDIVALSLGTRPDCLDEDVMDMLRDLKKIKPVFIELGLQTIHEETARRIRRGYELSVFEDAYKRLKGEGFEVIVHVIFNLPGESREDMLETVRYLSKLNPQLDGIKLQMLQILEGTDMAMEYKESPFPLMNMEEYTDLIVECIRVLPDDIVVHRMTGDGPRKTLIAPLWSLDKKRVLNTLNKKLTVSYNDKV